MQEKVERLKVDWHRRGYDLGLGVGIAMGYATMGQIGFEGRFHYGAIGTVLNIASRLCNHANSGQILMTQRVGIATEEIAEGESIGELSLRGLLKPVAACTLLGVSPANDETD